MERVAQVFCKMDDAAEFCGRKQELRFPRVVAIGSQSAGKSSLMERLVGKKFLPTSSGMCTRCPLEIALVATSDACTDMWVEFDHLPKEGANLEAKRFKDFNLVSKEIEARSKALCKPTPNGPMLAVTAQKISMRLYGPNLVNLILVDLPGLVRIQIEGQSQDVVQQIENIARSYADDPNTIILAISQANTDVANSEALRLAKEVDREGNRTIAVFTKLDCVKKSRDVVDMLNGRTVKVKLGIIGVKNRSDEADEAKFTMDQVKKSEADFFRANLQEFAGRCGIDYLMRKLNSLFVKSMMEYVPKLRRAVSDRSEEIERRKRQLDRDLSNIERPHIYVLEEVKELVRLFASELSSGVDCSASNCGAQLYTIMHEVLQGKLQSLQSPWKGKKKALATAIANSRGMVPSSFIQQDAFQNMAKSQLDVLRAPLSECIEAVRQRIIAALDRCAKKLRCSQNNALFCSDLREKAGEYLSTVFKQVHDQVELLVFYEQEYVALSKNVREYTTVSSSDLTVQTESLFGNSAVSAPTALFGSHASQKQSQAGLRPLTEQHVTDRQSAHWNSDVDEMEKLLEVHFDETRSHIARMVPKAIVYHIEKARKSELEHRLNADYRSCSEDQLKAKLSGIASLEDEVERVNFEYNEVAKYSLLVSELDRELAKVANPDV